MITKIDYDLRNYSEKEQRAFSVTNQFIPNEELFMFIKTITNLCPKLVLAGSIGLHVLRVIEIEDWEKRHPDLDFSLTEPLDEYEFDQILALLELTPLVADNYDSDVDENQTKPTTSQILKQKLIRLNNEKLKINIDIFNNEYNNDFKLKNNENLYFVNFPNPEVDTTVPVWERTRTPQLIPVQHPSVTISHKMKYAFYPNYGKRGKHKDDCIDYLCKDHDRMLTIIRALDSKKLEFEKALKVKYKSLAEIQEPAIRLSDELSW